jgi:2-hydroxychromene-2-carboxylate isomerase
MHRATWWFDFISPFAYLQWKQLPRLRDRVSFEPRPILFAALLDHHGQKGPAEIAGKRTFTYRFATWLGRHRGVPLHFPPAHPFNPLTALRLCIALDSRDEAIDAIFDHIWVDGLAADSPAALAPVAARLGVAGVEGAIAAPEVKQALRANTEAAIAAGVFGVPTVDVKGQRFWGQDATPMLEDWLDDPGAFDDAEMRRLDELPMAARRV